MMKIYKTLSLLLLGLFCLNTTHAQNVQWASKVKGFSSEFVDKNSSPRYRAIQVLGKPNVMPQGGESPCAWSPKKKKKWGKEWIHVAFDQPMQIKQVAIAESFRCGTVVGVKLIDEQGKGHKVNAYESVEPGTSSRMFRIQMPLTPYKVKEVIVYLRTSLVKGWNHIDAIGISDSDTPIEAEINTIKSDEVLKLERLNDLVNCAYEDLKPMISADGKTLFITRKDHPKNYGGKGKDDIWVCERLGEAWGPATQLTAPLNNSGHNYVNGVSPDGNVLLLGNIYSTSSNKAKGMSMSHIRYGEWQYPEALNIDNYYNHSIYMEAHITSNFKAIVMAVWRNDTYGKRDLYVSFNQGDKNWSKPLNLGPMINTAATEMAPFLAADGKTLYFSSDGYSGYGQQDIYVSHRLDDTWQNWSEPVNMGPIINSDGWDAYLSLDAEGEYAFLSRGEKGEDNDADIYKIHLIEEVRPERMQVLEIAIRGLDKDTEAMLSYAGIDDKESAGIAYSKTTAEGDFFHITAKLTGSYILMVSAKGYKDVELVVDVNSDEVLEVQLEKIE
jgi:hypothetical protein